MRTWTLSACVVLACTIMAVFLTAGPNGPPPRPQATTRTATSTTEVTLTRTLSPAAPAAAGRPPAARYAVQPGDTLSGIAARFAVPGGWAALYAANRPLIGPDPDTIRPGTMLTLPSVTTPVRYWVTAGDTLSGIAARFAVPGGWAALYAANRPLIGPDPNTIRPGLMLTLSHPAAPAPPATGPARTSPPRPALPSPSPSLSPGTGHHPRPGTSPAPVTAGMPQWLKTLLLAVGLLILAAFLTEPVLAARRRRRQAASQALQPRAADPGQGPTPKRPSAEMPQIVLADHDRLVVTRNKRDGTVYVLRPPGEDPEAILRVARLALPEGSYAQLARQLGMPASWPVVLADHDRLVVTRDKRDGTVCVLRPPGEDPKAILRVARLVLPEGSYGELAEQLGMSASWPLEPRRSPRWAGAKVPASRRPAHGPSA